MILITLLGSNSTYPAPSAEEIENDISEFRNYFFKRFPDIALQDYGLGVSALPQYAVHKDSWKKFGPSPGFEGDLNTGRLRWNALFSNGSRFEQCFSTQPSANNFPYFAAGSVHTIVSVINQCLRTNGEKTLPLDSEELATLVAIFKGSANGNPILVDYSDERMREIYDQGRRFYWARRGQNNFSCASCHINNAGNRLRGDVLSAALGQTASYPIYRLKWAISDYGDPSLPWITTHQRYQNCNLQAGAEPFAAQSPQYIALEVYQSIMNTGIPLNAPGQRR